MSLLSDIIKFKPNGSLFEAKGKNVMNVETYSIGNYEDVESLKVIKKQFTYNSENAKFIESAIVPKSIDVIKDNRIDIIVAPQSSSKLLQHYCETLSKKTGCRFIDNVFAKSNPSEITIDSGDTKLDLKTLKSLTAIIEKSEQLGYFELKKVPLQFRKFFYGYIKLIGDNQIFRDKNVLVVDDVLSSGSTISELYRIVYANGANKIIGLTMLKKK